MRLFRLLLLDFSADDVKIQPSGKQLRFTDLSTNTPTSSAWVFTPNTVTYTGGTNPAHKIPGAIECGRKL